jgi:Protein of unknown function (DUF3568)
VKGRTLGMSLAAAILAVTLTGCVETLVATGVLVGGSATGLFLSGANEDIDAPFPKVVAATSVTLEEIGDRIIEKTVEIDSAKFVSRFNDGAKITITLSRESASDTYAKVWVGFWGDRTASQTILRQINDNIKKTSDASVKLQAAK